VSSCGPARNRGTGCLTVLASPLVTLMPHDLEKEEQDMGEIMRRVLGNKMREPYERSMISWHFVVQNNPGRPNMSGLIWTSPTSDWICLTMADFP
jgi:hypothetical protein